MASIAFINRPEPTARVHVSNSRKKLLNDTSLSPGLDSVFTEQLSSTLSKFTQFWELMETIKRHGYLRSAMSTIGRSAIGAGWEIVRHPEYGKKSPDRHRRVLYQFYMGKGKQWDNIKDFQSIAYKIMIASMYLRYFGQAGFHILRDENGNPIGLDFIHGLIIPNVDSEGNFKDGVAFYQYPTSNPKDRIEYKDPKDVIYIINPDWEGSPMGGTDIEALATYTLPIDLYLQLGAREYLKKRDKPEVYYELPENITEEAFNTFVAEVESRWQGPTNQGYAPVAVAGSFKIHELSKFPDKIPFLESRRDARDESLAVAGVSGSKLGLPGETDGNVRENRREFHETSMMPLFEMIEISLYEQLHVREFHYIGWIFRFKRPDFQSAVEQATVHMRYREMNAITINEIREDLGKEPVEGGDELDIPMNEPPPQQQGSPPEGREEEPDDPSNTGEPTNDDQDPPRGDGHDEEPRSMSIDKSSSCRQEDESVDDCVGRKIPEIMEENPDMSAEQAQAIAFDMCEESCSDKEDSLNETLDALRDWRNFIVSRLKRNRSIRDFESEHLPEELKNIIEQNLLSAKTLDDVRAIFDEAIKVFSENL